MRDGEITGDRLRAPALWTGAAMVAISRVAMMPRTPWEMDEILFTESVMRFDPLHHHPHPPGYPLLTGMGKLINLAVHDPYRSLVILGVLAAIVTYLAFGSALRRILRDSPAAVVGSLLFLFCPAMLVNATLAMSDVPAVMFVALAAWSASILRERSSTGHAALFGVWCSAAIGTRPQYAVAVLPMLGWVLWEASREPRATSDERRATRALMDRWRVQAVGLATFAVVSLAWFVPLVIATGGLRGWWSYETAQAGYVAQHDAFLSRGGRSAVGIVLRFVAHPWGPKWLSTPVLLAAFAGLIVAARARLTALLPLGIFAVIYIPFGLVVMDPADGVRYALPSLLAVSSLAALGLKWLGSVVRFRFLPVLVLALLVAGSVSYVLPIVIARVSGPSPPVLAARWARDSLPESSVVLYEKSLEPHAQLLLGRFHPLSVEKELSRYVDRPELPLYLFADGGSDDPRARVFAWPGGDVWGKLTRNHYRVVSMIPISPEERYAVIRGVSGFERTPEGEAWRWLSPGAVIRLPDSSHEMLHVALRLPPDSPIAQNEVILLERGRRLGRVVVARGKTVAAEIPLPETGGPFRIELRSTQSYVPSRVSTSLDSRRLGVQLVGLSSR